MFKVTKYVHLGNVRPPSGKFFCWTGFFVSVVVLAGCGYGFKGSGSVLPVEVKKVYIADVVNKSSDPYIGNTLTEALKEQFEQYGVVQVVSSAEEADASLRVRVQQLRSQSKSSVAAGDVAQELNVTVTLTGELQQRNGTLLWKNPAMSYTKSFGNTTGSVVTSSAQFATSGLGSGDLGLLNQRELSRSQERLALQQVAQDVANTIYDQAVSPDF
jgi:outer membrane lipopolysaccharide assembly protein LptE/RlpB